MAKTSMLLVCVASLLVSVGAGAQEIYQWRDSMGVTHFSDRPPLGERNATRLRMPRARRAGGLSGEGAEGGEQAAILGSPTRAQHRHSARAPRIANPLLGSASLDGGPSIRNAEPTLSAPELDHLMEAADRQPRPSRTGRRMRGWPALRAHRLPNPFGRAQPRGRMR